jgi:hypothetical protein
VLANDVLLENGPLCFEAARLANIWILRQAIFRSHDVGAQNQLGIALALKVVSRDVRLQPVEKRERDALGLLQHACEVLRSAVQQRFVVIVLPGPVHERNIGRCRRPGEVLASQEAAP